MIRNFGEKRMMIFSQLQVQSLSFMGKKSDWEKSLPTLIIAYNATHHHYETLMELFLVVNCISPTFHFYQSSNLTILPPSPPNSIEEELDFIIDLMRNYDAVWIRHQFQSFSLLPKFKSDNAPPPNSIEDLDFITDLMRNYDAVWKRHQFQSYIKPSEEIKPGD